MDKMSIHVYKCNPCKIYFDSYSSAFHHLRIRHDLKIKSVESVTFPKLSVSVERLKDDDNKVVQISTSTNGTQTKGRRGRKKKGPLEIKLDDLKASEIEALVENLYKSPAGGKGHRSRSARTAATIAKQALISSLYDQDEDLPKSPKRKTKPHIDKDHQVKGKRKGQRQEDDGQSSSRDIDLSDENEEEHEKRKTKQDQYDSIKKKGLCRLCKVTFPDRNYYIKHMRAKHVDKDGKYHCTHCYKFFSTLRLLTQHLKRLEDVRSHHCSDCGKSFPHPKDLRRHVKSHEVPRQRISSYSKNKFPCPLCPTRCKWLNKLQQHFLIHLENNPYTCKFTGCGRKFFRWDLLRRHVKLHTGQRDYKCHLCEAAFYRKDHLTNHLGLHERGNVAKPYPRNGMLTVQRVSDFVVDDVLKLSENKLESKEHSNILKEDPDYIRVEVGSQHFNDDTKNDFQDEEEETGTISIKEQTQPQILSSTTGKSVRSIIIEDPVFQKLLKENPEGANSVIPDYVRTRSNAVPTEKFPCPDCDYVAYRPYPLQQHVKRHHNKEISLPLPADSVSKALLCTQCGYHAASSADLSEHTETQHPIKKKFLCSLCSLSFENFIKRFHHMNQAHQSDKKYVCKDCGKKYLFPDSLRQHRNKNHNTNHGGFKRPNNSKSLERATCKLCGRGCANAYVLKRHIAYVHLHIQNPYNMKRKYNQVLNSQQDAPTANPNAQETEKSTAILGL